MCHASPWFEYLEFPLDPREIVPQQTAYKYLGLVLNSDLSLAEMGEVEQKE